MRKILVFLLFPTLLFSQTTKTASKAMVVSARVEASQIGSDIIKQGGNAFDAMIATQLALAVAYPYAGNISGGGFMVYRMADGKTGTLDFREVAPIKASRDMFLDANGNVIEGKSTESALSIGVPGSVAALFDVHAKFGSLPIEKLFAPAIALARKGVVVTKHDFEHLQEYHNDIVRLNGKETLLAQPFKTGDTIKYNALAETLERISQNGRTEFYRGETAQKLVAHISKKGGIMTIDDLAAYETKWRDPLKFKYRKLDIVTMGPPSSGGICLQQILAMIEPYDVKKLGHNSTKFIQLLVEAERRSYADRNHFLGDPDFLQLPLNEMQDKAYLKNRMKDFSFEKATKSSDVSHGDIVFSESDETTHFSIVDDKGNAVAVTTTLNGAFGSKLYCDELGFFLNNEMDDFSAKPGSPNMFGLTGTKANSIAPRKRMLSSMTPTIVEKDGKLFMLLGSPGGSTIITSVLQTILNVYEFDMPMQKAVDQPRFHHQWLPDLVIMEPDRFDLKIIDALKSKGYEIDQRFWSVLGKVDAIKIGPGGKRESGADGRGDDSAVGF
ncbi:MAG: gamma-glutamyltransferase [Flavobacterium sp.]|uniref:gamma-glutamyltransferase n=1 Tax=Flavobacterium sp. TaxID=239 RepID=UPI001204B563|nr:gamma-glutamyltransferase [Flavobacterium sp.]RZJ68354.1 MAG: gamma-glutamyltransferase [Flavobacterium sp.]